MKLILTTSEAEAILANISLAGLHPQVEITQTSNNTPRNLDWTKVHQGLAQQNSRLHAIKHVLDVVRNQGFYMGIAEAKHLVEAFLELAENLQAARLEKSDREDREREYAVDHPIE